MRLDEMRNVGLTESQKEIRRSVRDFAAKEIIPVIPQYEREARWPKEIVEKIGELGYLGCIIPEQYGGAGLDYLSYGIICEEIAYADWVSASVISVQNSLVGTSLLRFGTEKQKERYLVPLAQGKKIASAALTEPNAGSDLASIQTTAMLDGDDYVLNGSKVFISHGNHADLFFLLATIDRSLKHKGVCAFIVERGMPGFSQNPFPLHGMKRGDVAELVFEDCRVPRENLLAGEGQGFKVVASALDVGRFSVAARCVGQAQACVDASLKYARERVQFDQEIGKFQMVQQMIADMMTSVEAARQLVYGLGRLKDAGLERASLEASMAKLFASDVCMKAVLDAIQIHGGYGLAEEYPVGRFLYEAKVLQIGEGTNQLHRMLIAEYALGYRRL